MNYFQMTEQQQYRTRRSLVFVLLAKMKRDKFKVHPYVVVLGYLKQLKEQAFEKEHYELLEIIKIILNNKEIEI